MKRPLAETILTLAVGTALLASGCSSSANDQDQVLTVFGNQRGAEAEAFRSVLAIFEEDTGIEVRFTGSASFPKAIRERVEEGNAPDIALFPQPGLLDDLADEGLVLPLRSDVADAAGRSLLPSLAGAFGAQDSSNGILYQLHVKSLVWYSPAVFAANGYELPTTWSGMKDLTSRITADGFTPWCLGVSAFDATGWPATDWVEDIVLREDGTEVYDVWVAGGLSFTSEPIRSALDDFGTLVLKSQNSQGRRGILNTSPAAAQGPMFTSPPGCLMYKMASFQLPNLPSGTTVGPNGDLDVFVLPGPTEGAAPILIGGSVAAAFTDSDATWELMRFLASPEAGVPWAERGGYISPHADFDPDAYTDDFYRRMASIVADADSVRFDGSDLMYSPVGTRSFFDAMVQYIGTDRLDPSLTTAQDGYDR